MRRMDEAVGAIETGGTRVRCAWGSAPGELRDVHELSTGAPGEVLEAIGDYFAAAPIVRRVGVAAFGPIGVDREGPGWGRLRRTPKEGWSGVELGRELERRLGADVVLDTDVNAAALAEARWGAGRGADPVAYVTAGTGIGVGATVGGRPLHGLLHPEAGHLPVRRADGDTFAGACPFHGDCWEGLAAGPALAQRWDADPARLPDDHPAWAMEAYYLAQGIASVVLVLSPQRVVLGGGVGTRPGMIERVRALLIEALADTVGRPADAPEAQELVVAPAFARAGLVGALGLALR
jgi:fructokinase